MNGTHATRINLSHFVCRSACSRLALTLARKSNRLQEGESFMAKVYVIRTLDGSNANVEDPTTTEFHGLPCLMGKAISATPNSWVIGATSYVPLAQIVDIVVFDRREDYEDGLKRYAAAHNKPII
jgi:hypothetical protein